jgi:undecaprenyl diphosphate synthase
VTVARFSHQSAYFSEEELMAAWERPIPQHVAIIMDGNRRWAKKQFLKIAKPFGGHWEGADVLIDILEAASDLGVKILTVYAFSTENWERSPEEVNTLVKIFFTYLEKNRLKMVEKEIKFHVIGDISPFPAFLKQSIETTIRETAAGKGIKFVVALNYGGRNELVRVMKEIFFKIQQGRLAPSSLSEETISSHLDTAAFGDPDLLIRTSGEQRLSNFLLWQIAYAEVYVTETLWPDFTPRDLLKAVLDFQKRQRRVGK